MSSGQKDIIKKLAEIDKGLPDGVSLTFAIDNMAELMDKDEKDELLKGIMSLIEDNYLTKHTDKKTKNEIPFWLEFTKRGREFCKQLV